MHTERKRIRSSKLIRNDGPKEVSCLAVRSEESDKREAGSGKQRAKRSTLDVNRGGIT